MTHTVYLGYDARETRAYDVAARSIRRRTKDVWIRPVGLHHLAHVAHRPVEERDGKLWCPVSQAPMATEFAISRFCVPFLHHRGWCAFMDCDIVCLADIADLFKLADDKYAVMCVKHEQTSGPAEKMDGQAQTYYARKNWSSVVLWNCDHPANKRLTVEAMRTWPGRDLHAFKWLEDGEIGALPKVWNHLVGVTVDHESYCTWLGTMQGAAEVGCDCGYNPKILHYTLGGKWLPDWPGGPLDEVWEAENARDFAGSV